MIDWHHRQLTFYVSSRHLWDFFVHLDHNNNLGRSLTDNCAEVCTIERLSCSLKMQTLARRLAFGSAVEWGTFHCGDDDVGDDGVFDGFSQSLIVQPSISQLSSVVDEALRC